MAWLWGTVFLCFIQLAVCQDVSYQTFYFQQHVDHFSFTQNHTFEQKYLYADQYWEPGAPIFFYTGNEGDIETFCYNTGFMWEIAPEYKAMIVFAEHRYYGASLPFGEESYSSPEHIGYLSSEQALADFAELIHYLKSSIKGAEDSPVIAFGGSYGGMLAAWFRLKYPHVVVGAISASAPVAQFPGVTPCEVFGNIVTKDFQDASPHCAENIRSSWKVLKEAGKTEESRQWLSSSWKLCKPLKNESDVQELLYYLTDSYDSLAMMDYPYPTNFVADLPGYPVKRFCENLDQPNLTGKTLLSELFKAMNVYFNYTGKATCMEYNIHDNGIGYKGWDYQTCTEMVMPMCTTGKEDMFDVAPWSFDEWAAGCKERWGVSPRRDMAVTMYGGRDLSYASNIVLSNGLLDPWSGGSILKNLSETVIAVIIPEGAHHLDLRSSNPQDPESVIAARNIERQMIWKWINEYKPVIL